PSRDFTSEVLFSSRMISMQSSTHSSQMKTVGPAISLRTSCWLLPQNEQYSVFLDSPLTLLIPVSFTSRLSRIPHPKSYAEFLSSMTSARHASQASINIRLTLLPPGIASNPHHSSLQRQCRKALEPAFLRDKSAIFAVFSAL